MGTDFPLNNAPDVSREVAVLSYTLDPEALERYRQVGAFPDEWRLHHQGGLTGYTSREIIATPHTQQEIQAGQAFAWNPSITGAKAEETFILT